MRENSYIVYRTVTVSSVFCNSPPPTPPNCRKDPIYPSHTTALRTSFTGGITASTTPLTIPLTAVTTPLRGPMSAPEAMALRPPPNGGRDPVTPCGSGALLPISGRKCQFVIMFRALCTIYILGVEIRV